MYNFYPKEDVRDRLSKHYMERIVVDANDRANDVMVKVGNEPFLRMTPDEIAKIITNDKNSCAFVEYGGLMVFKSESEMNDYRKGRR